MESIFLSLYFSVRKKIDIIQRLHVVPFRKRSVVPIIIVTRPIDKASLQRFHPRIASFFHPMTIQLLHPRHLGAKNTIQRPGNNNNNPAAPIAVPNETAAAPGEPGAAACPARIIGPFACDHPVVVPDVANQLLLRVDEGFGERGG